MNRTMIAFALAIGGAAVPVGLTLVPVAGRPVGILHFENDADRVAQAVVAEGGVLIGRGGPHVTFAVFGQMRLAFSVARDGPWIVLDAAGLGGCQTPLPA